ncbi:MAG: glycerol-3-phosphate 1-O-acyltransferase PlsY [Verrucomicrobiota bacterium]|nr:glycerol-3-phosphate 1-O-acyltransferase PlsY [Verrucomicrobiota bacterium]
MDYLLAMALSVVVGYLLGSLPFAMLIAKRFGVDIFKEGSGNPGATNVKRVLSEKFGKAGKRAGNLCFALDALKGFLAATWPTWIGAWSMHDTEYQVVGMLAAIVGHSFSIFQRFKGGKGVATTVGGMLAITPFVMVLGLVVWLVAFFATGYVSVASILLGVSLPLTAIIFDHHPHGNDKALVIILCLLIAVLIVIRHRTNIQRLQAGTEHKFKRKRHHPKGS